MYKSHIMRKMISLIILVLCFANITAGQNSNYNTVTKNGKTFYVYKVKQGEGLYAVSRIFDVSVADLLKSNPDAQSGLKNGQDLLVPVIGEVKETIEINQNRLPQNIVQSSTFKHTVTRGMTLYSIAQMYETTVAEIKRLNPGLSDDISEGQVIIIPQKKNIATSSTGYMYHTIQPKETLYSVSKQYSLKPEDLKEANSGLTAETFQIGKIIRVPVEQIISRQVEVQFDNEIHKVKRGETLFNISQQYGLKVADIEKANPNINFTSGIKPDMEILIPTRIGDSVTNEIDADRLLSHISADLRTNVIRVGLLLPFLDESDNQHYRVQEYYEGFLMSVEKMKEAGANIEVYVFEIGTQAKLESLLGTMEMQYLHLIVGGMTDKQIATISDFSQKYNVKYVIPFSSKNNEVMNNDKIFQVNSPHLYLYAKASTVFMEQFSSKNIVLVNVPSKNDKKDFVTILKSDLRRNNIKYSEVTLNSNLTANISPLLKSDVENVIVPTTGDSGALKDIMHSLSESMQQNEGIVTRLFGYPEWQTFSSDLQSLMHTFGTYFYTSFYVDNQNAQTRNFIQDFKKWYGRDLIETYPKYGIFGYDTGLYFLNAIYKHGVNFEKNIEQIDSSLALQFAFNFERVNNWGGFVNSGLFLIHYDTDRKIHKINKSR